MERNLNSADQHRQIAAEQEEVIHLAIVTVSDSRTPESDTNYHFLSNAIKAAGYTVAGYRIVKDEADEVTHALEEMVQTPAQIIMFNGGTGIAKRDRTYDVLIHKIEKEMNGFGEIFRMLSYEQVGAAAMLSRATAGVYKGKLIVSTPGSPAAVQLAWEKLILPEIHHLAWELVR
ncbi:MAG: molybdenum cofactor biosynthesis protein B [Chloroflexota bacterium]